MSFSRTFKNPAIDYNTDCWHSDGWGYEIEGEIFEENLWDMEITFTKKNKVINIGDQVDVYDDEGYPWQGNVIWFDERHALISQNWGAPKVVKREHIGL